MIFKSDDIYPEEPSPLTVEVRLKILLTPIPVENEEKERLIIFVVEIKEDVKEAVDRYPADPRPMTVEVRFATLAG